jgi:hypothetical protein
MVATDYRNDDRVGLSLAFIYLRIVLGVNAVTEGPASQRLMRKPRSPAAVHHIARSSRTSWRGVRYRARAILNQSSIPHTGVRYGVRDCQTRKADTLWASPISGRSSRFVSKLMGLSRDRGVREWVRDIWRRLPASVLMGRELSGLAVEC